MNSLYINKCKAFIDFMLAQQQWSGLTKASIDSWLSNFRGLPLEEQELVYKGYKYIFNEGNFIKKEEINDLEVINESKDKMYTKLSSSEEKSPDKLYVKDIKDDQVTNLDSSKENFDKKSLTDFIKDLINKDKN